MEHTKEDSASHTENCASACVKNKGFFLNKNKNKDANNNSVTRICDICYEHPARYTFKCCTWKCCSLTCYKKHCDNNQLLNQNESFLSEATTDTDTPINAIPIENVNKTLPNPDKIIHNHRHSSFQLAPCGGPRHLKRTEMASLNSTRTLGAKANEYSRVEREVAEELGCLTEECKKRLQENEKLQKWVESLSIRKAVRHIDNSMNRVDQLGRYMVHPEFNEFIMTLKDVLDEDDDTKDDIS